MRDARRVFIVEDDFLIAEYLRALCRENGQDVVGNAAEANTALTRIDELRPDFVLMDVRLKGERDGVDIALAIHERHPRTRVVFITGSSEPSTLERIDEDHPYRVLIKPIDPEELFVALSG